MTFFRVGDYKLFFGNVEKLNPNTIQKFCIPRIEKDLNVFIGFYNFIMLCWMIELKSIVSMRIAGSRSALTMVVF